MVGLLLISGAINGEKVERILTNIVALIFAKLVGASCPSVTKRDDVIDLDSARGVLTANKIDSFTCVGVGKRATLNLTVFHNSVSEVASKNRFARSTTATSAAPVVIKKFAIVFFVYIYIGAGGIPLFNGNRQFAQGSNQFVYILLQGAVYFLAWYFVGSASDRKISCYDILCLAVLSADLLFTANRTPPLKIIYAFLIVLITARKKLNTLIYLNNLDMRFS